jgi:hypothetical protein
VRQVVVKRGIGGITGLDARSSRSDLFRDFTGLEEREHF